MTPPTAHVFHAAQLRELADGKSYARGEQYAREGRVTALSREGKTITATVSGQKSYDVKLWVTGDRIAYTCSCPMGEEGTFCKHCVAVALSLIEKTTPKPSAVIDDESTVVSGGAAGAQIVTPPTELPGADCVSVFLAGSIDMGHAVRWQDDLAAALSDVEGLVIFNPRRPDWDASWKQSIDDERFREQVEWELAAMQQADVIAMYFAPDSQAPITLLELGLYAESGKLVVCCPEGYWRKGNVDVVCRRYAVHQTHDLQALARAARARIASSRR